MNRQAPKCAALVFLLVLFAVDRSEATQILFEQIPFNSATSGFTQIDLDSLVASVGYPQIFPGGPDHYGTSLSGPSVTDVQLVGFGSLPSSLALLLLGIVGLVFARYRGRAVSLTAANCHHRRMRFLALALSLAVASGAMAQPVRSTREAYALAQGHFDRIAGCGGLALEEPEDIGQHWAFTVVAGYRPEFDPNPILVDKETGEVTWASDADYSNPQPDSRRE